jgi:hypothetical protein
VGAPGAEVLAELNPEQIIWFDRAMQLREAGKAVEAEKILKSLKAEFGDKVFSRAEGLFGDAGKAKPLAEVKAPEVKTAAETKPSVVKDKPPPVENNRYRPRPHLQKRRRPSRSTWRAAEKSRDRSRIPPAADLTSAANHPSRSRNRARGSGRSPWARGWRRGASNPGARPIPGWRIVLNIISSRKKRSTENGSRTAE